MATDSITCPRCGMTSYNPNDIREGYCGNCHDWTALPVNEHGNVIDYGPQFDESDD